MPDLQETLEGLIDFMVAQEVYPASERARASFVLGITLGYLTRDWKLVPRTFDVGNTSIGVVGLDTYERLLEVARRAKSHVEQCYGISQDDVLILNQSCNPELAIRLQEAIRALRPGDLYKEQR